MPLPLTSTHHFHLRGHSAEVHFVDESMCINVIAPGEVVNDLEIVLHSLGTAKARALAQSILAECERIDPTVQLTRREGVSIEDAVQMGLAAATRPANVIGTHGHD